MDEVERVKQMQRAMWAAGEYGSCAPMIWDVGARVVSRTGAGPGDELLDVACGTGNAAIQAVGGCHRGPPHASAAAQPPARWAAGARRGDLRGHRHRAGVLARDRALRRPLRRPGGRGPRGQLRPIVTARELLEPQGKWQALRDDLGAMFARRSSAGDGGIVTDAEYRLILGRRPA